MKHHFLTNQFEFIFTLGMQVSGYFEGQKSHTWEALKPTPPCSLQQFWVGWFSVITRAWKQVHDEGRLGQQYKVTLPNLFLGDDTSVKLLGHNRRPPLSKVWSYRLGLLGQNQNWRSQITYHQNTIYRILDYKTHFRPPNLGEKWGSVL